MKASEVRETIRDWEEDVAVCPDCWHPLKKIECDSGMCLICSNSMCMNEEQYAEEIEEYNTEEMILPDGTILTISGGA